MMENRYFSRIIAKFFLPNGATSAEKTASLFSRNPNTCSHPTMKLPAFLLAATAAFAVNAQAQVPLSPASIKLGKVEISAPSTPEYQVTGGQNKRFKTKNWLEFEIGYETKVDEIDELTFKFTALVEGKLLDGEVTYVNISKGDHYAVAYISPKSLEKLTGGKTFTSAGLGNVWVEVNRQGQVLAREALKGSNQPNVPRVTGMIVNKSQTPFAPLYYDRYEEIKAQR
jgi:hypothetical protein